MCVPLLTHLHCVCVFGMCSQHIIGACEHWVWWLSAEPPPAPGEVVQPALAAEKMEEVEPASPAKPELSKAVERATAPAAPWRAQLYAYSHQCAEMPGAPFPAGWAHGDDQPQGARELRAQQLG